LLVEDNQLNHFLIKKQIEKYGAKVISAFDGEDALVKFNEEKIDLIILDMLMPKLNGDEVVAKLNTIYNHLPPIIIFTANVLELNKLNSINHLITKIITKPISERELINEINMVI